MLKLEHWKSQPARRVMLDGEPVAVPDDVEASLVAIRAYLEFIALQRRRVVNTMWVDGVEIETPDEMEYAGPFTQIEADTITFQELSRRLITTALGELEGLTNLVQSASLRILISTRVEVCRQWQTWLPQFRTPLVSLGFLRELWGDRVEGVTLGKRTLGGHIDSLNLILCEVDAILLSGDGEWEIDDLVTLSCVLDERLIPWLEKMKEFLYELEELPINQ